MSDERCSALCLRLALFRQCHHETEPWSSQGQLSRGGHSAVVCACSQSSWQATAVLQGWLCPVLCSYVKRARFVRVVCVAFFFFFFSHLSNAAFVIAWCSGGEKLEPKSIFVFLLLCILICFLSTTFVFALRDLFGAQRTVLCRCSGMLTYVWRKSRCAYLFCIAFL